MTDVFISYSRSDRTVAQALAADLTSRGFIVWWDYELYAGQDFRTEISAAIDRCKAAIVIWSPTAVASTFVRDEADRAARQSKLIPTRLSGFDFAKIPLGMGQHHCVDVEDREQIFRALQHLGIIPHPPKPGRVYTAQDHLLDDDALIAKHRDPRIRKRQYDLSRSLAMIDTILPAWTDQPKITVLLHRIKKLASSGVTSMHVLTRIGYLGLFAVDDATKHLQHEMRTRKLRYIMEPLALIFMKAPRKGKQ